MRTGCDGRGEFALNKYRVMLVDDEEDVIQVIIRKMDWEHWPMPSNQIGGVPQEINVGIL